jgi:hypothetical protein
MADLGFVGLGGMDSPRQRSAKQVNSLRGREQLIRSSFAD